MRGRGAYPAGMRPNPSHLVQPRRRLWLQARARTTCGPCSDGLDLPAVPADVLVGTDTGDDAAVWRAVRRRRVVATLDFFTPIVDDPYDWGRIAATNALSDVYAMGGRPFLGLNIVSWPVDDLPLEMLGRVLQGGIDAAAKAGVAVLGGHSITDPEPKYGMVVLGFVDPRPDR